MGSSSPAIAASFRRCGQIRARAAFDAVEIGLHEVPQVIDVALYPRPGRRPFGSRDARYGVELLLQRIATLEDVPEAPIAFRLQLASRTVRRGPQIVDIAVEVDEILFHFGPVVD